MKKIITILLLLVGVVTTTYAQKDLGKYVGLGAGYDGYAGTIGGEVGLWNDKNWYSIVVENQMFDTTPTVYIGPKYYRKVDTIQIVDLFVFGTTKMALTKTHLLQFEAGAASVFNLSDSWALQFNISGYTDKSFKGLSPSVSGGLNFFF